MTLRDVILQNHMDKFNVVGLAGQPGFSAAFAGVAVLVGVIVFLAVLAWSLYWKGRALWIAARRKELAWFILILLINTLGVLEIVYIYFIAKDKKHNSNNQSK